MTKKKLLIIGITVATLLILFLIYWFYLASPTAFPADEQIAEEITETFPQAAIKTIQDKIELDPNHVFVPFISKGDKYGTSYWIWEKHKWKLTYIDTTGEPMLWKINKASPASSYVVWNIHPDDQISYADFYMIRDRGYHISDNKHRYIPRIQMKVTQKLEGKSYGTLKLPDDWRSIINQANKLVSEQDSNLYFSGLVPGGSINIGWIPYTNKGEIPFPENSVNGNSYTNGNIQLDFVRILNTSELEK